MHVTLVRLAVTATALFGLFASAAAPGSSATPTATVAPSPTPRPHPLAVSGFARSYLFTRQNASNNPGARFVSGARYSSAGVNQSTWAQALGLHADYALPGGRWHVGASYLYGDSFAGGCSDASAHGKGMSCVSRTPPATNPDDTVPDFALSTLYESYLGYRDGALSAKIGDQLFDSPWAGPADTRLKPASFRGVDLDYRPREWRFELADMLQYEPRNGASFVRGTLLTTHPVGNNGLPANIYVPGNGVIATDGFLYARAGYGSRDGRYAANAYWWAISDIENMYWADARYFAAKGWKPYVALQAGFERNSGASVLGTIDSSLFGIQVGATVAKDVTVSASYDEIPWRYDSVTLRNGYTCDGATLQIVTPQSRNQPGATLPYFLPLNAAQCRTETDGTTTIAYGGWASPYTDNYTNAPIFTTAISQSMADRRAPGTSWRLQAAYASPDRRATLAVGASWFDYGNRLAAERTSEIGFDGTFHFAPVPRSGPYRGLRLRYRYADRRYSNTFCGATDTDCPAGLAYGASFLGGLPLFKYSRTMLEYDF